MNGLTIAKFAIVGVAEAGLWTLAALGRISPTDAVTYSTVVVVGLLSALGLSAGGAAAGNAIGAHLAKRIGSSSKE